MSKLVFNSIPDTPLTNRVREIIAASSAKPGEPIPIPADLQESIDCSLAERCRASLLQVRRGEYMPGRGDPKPDWITDL